SEMTPIRIPLSENPEFKTIRNAVITAACELDTDIRNNLFPYDDEDDIYGIDVSEEDISLQPQQTDNKSDIAYYSDKNTINTSHITCYQSNTPAYMATSVSRLLNSVSRIFREKFQDNPEHIPKVDIKLRRKIQEKEEAHGIKHG
ncbi:MAG: hypothetical protein IKP31_06590, partial [Lachnospiraceae bacterium]|nr:hypothetical protein [Lachnospiraceae bacterium]